MSRLMGICAIAVCLGLVGFAANSHVRSATEFAEDNGHACLVDFDTPCSVLR